MADSESGASGEQPVGPQPPRRPRRGERDSPDVFDIWLQRGLHQLYDSVTKEPVPEELLRLIEQNRSDRSK
jgi:hypothetical protein